MAAEKGSNRICWPEGKTFAFTVFDDTDNDDIDKTRPVYELLASCGLRTTKSCWVRRPGPQETGYCPGMTTEDPEYLQYILGLQAQGFEIALHNVSWASSTRQQIAEGLDRFERQLSHRPRVFANHAGTADSVYWGPRRFSGIRSFLYNLSTRFRNNNRFTGHVESSPHFWGDFCFDRVAYVRSFTFKQTNTLEVCPQTPYHDRSRPYVRNWFASCDGHNLPAFIEAISESRQDQLEAASGCCIMYTHFASHFANGGTVDGEFERLIRRLSAKNGWFVPVGQLLDHIVQQRGQYEITPRELARLEWRWLCQKIITGITA